ncbi:iron complex outermembrane recepter protein [Fodinibius roseus]|uniref:Iron complex outermembrane recepter protein n=1 Tax=Fodinibius roseus TaxID=1194090 RepID=A0A1M4UW15_9BACT|nr:TonB-dependent siderophore receptor [Fodinibius roseus]SHE60837.1 iron complex outermembrane recepter protein [Fodinibius roseus]
MHFNISIPRITGLIFFVLSLSFSQAQAQTGTVKGQVTHEQDRSPLSDINIALEGTHYGTATGSDGTYTLDEIPAGDYSVVASGVGYVRSSETITIEAGESVVLNFSMTVSTQELSEVTVTGQGGYNTSISSSSLKIRGSLLETPQNIQVITGDLIRDQQIFNMVEGIARNVSGVHREEHWDNMYARIYMRGSKIPAFRNGMNVEMPWGPLAEDMSMVERIEFVKGPAGFMMANGEPAGFYNVVTDKPTGQTRASASLTTGSFNTLRATADFDGKLTSDNTLLYRLNVMGQQKDSHRKFDYTNRYAVAPVLQYNFDSHTSLTAEYTYQSSEFHQPGGYVASLDGYGTLPRDFTVSDPKIGPSEIKDHSLFLTLEHRLSEQWSLTAKMAYFDYSAIGQYVYPGGEIDEQGNLARTVSVWDGHSENKLGQVFVNGNIKTGAARHEILGGLDLSDKQYIAVFATTGQIPDLNIYEPEYNISADTIPEYNPAKSLNNRAGWRDNLSHRAIYIQDEIHLFDDNLRLTLAGRFTDSRSDETEEQVFTPRAGLSVNLDDNTSVYALYDQAYLPQGGQNFEGESFDPVTGHNIEAGLKRQWFGSRWNSTVSAYRITKENVLTTDPDHPDFSVQLGQIQTQGVEVDVRGRLARGLNLVVNYAFTDSKVTEDTNEEVEGEPTPGAIRHLNNAWLSYHVPGGALEGVGLSLGYMWKIGRTSWFSEQNSLPDYFKLDGGISWENDRFNLSLNVNNLLDEYLYSGFPSGEKYIWISEPPRNFRLSVGYKF